MNKLNLLLALVTVPLCSHQQPASHSSPYSLVLQSATQPGLGSFKLHIGPHRLVERQGFYCWRKTADGVKRLSTDSLHLTKPDGEFQTRHCTLTGEDGRTYATISQKVSRTHTTITVHSRATVQQDFTLPQRWMGFMELLAMPTSELVGTTVESVRRKDGARFIALVPPRYSPQVWSLRSEGSRQICLVFPHAKVTFDAGPGTLMNFNHYGGRTIEFAITPSVKSYGLNLKAGQTFHWSYVITVEPI